MVATGGSQLLRWIMELNGSEDLDIEVNSVKQHIKKLKKSVDFENKIKDLYKSLYDLQYQKSPHD